MTNSPESTVHPLRIADARNAVRHVFIHDMVVSCLIGIHRHEKTGAQRIRINLDLAVREDVAPLNDNHSNVLCYEDVAKSIRSIAARGHVNLVETLAEDIATMCLEDIRILSVRVRIEKLDVFADVESVGVEIERVRH
ncbi:MAG: dihydroneopterin aldolase [Rhodospirillales bacterium]|jgi:7,8-dihydroneopterin aldolase/epimerase/oxygenase|nr:dihydroneopterin aldolase [Rhodospirillales bacterium]